MSDEKYQLLRLPDDSKAILLQPWWRERLRTKYIKSLQPTDAPKAVNSQNWTFIKDGLDDFRSGQPAVLDSDFLIKGNKGLLPNIHGSKRKVKVAVNGDLLTKHETYYSKAIPQTERQRQRVQDIENDFLDHPLALHSHYEESLPTSLFDTVVYYLDPVMSMEPDDESDDRIEEEPASAMEAEKDETDAADDDENYVEEEDTDTARLDEQKVRNPYKWQIRKDEKEKRDKKKLLDRRTDTAAEDQHIKHVTKEFCDWVAGLGGETNNIEESTISSLFASGYETKPALSVPIHVIELTNVPQELRASAVGTQQVHVPSILVPSTAEEQKANGPEQKWEKFKYGEWYLPPKTWKKRLANEPLRDPEELKKEDTSEAKKKSNQLEHELAPIHGTKAFMAFIEERKCRKPEFLTQVAMIQQAQALEEQAKLQHEERLKHRASRKAGLKT